MNVDSKYYDEYYDYILDKVEPSTKTKKAVFNIIADLTDRRGIKHEFNRIDADIQDEIIETWMNKIDSAIINMTEYKKYKGSEANLQKAVASYLDFKGVLWFHPPNEIKAKPQYMAKRKQQGVKSGVPDVCILEPNSKYYGLFIELKVAYNKPNENQIKWMNRLNAKGFKAVWSNSLDETKAIIDEYLKIKK